MKKLYIILLLPLYFITNPFNYNIIKTEGCINNEDKLNVLLIFADDLTTTAISAYGNHAPSTPNIDQLAANGTLFKNAYSQYPVCGPSRASILFGYYPNATKAYGYESGRKQVGPNKKSLPQLFKENGYYTARVSKIFHMDVPGDIEKGSHGTDDKNSWTERFNSQGPEWKAPGIGELVQNNPKGNKPVQGGNVMSIVKASGDDLIHSDGQTAKKASEIIKKQANNPFFLAVGFVRPHVPFVAPKNYFEPYDYNTINLPPKVKNDWDDIPEPGINYVNSKNAQMSEEQEQKAIAAYYASVSYMDAQLGKILKTLEEENLTDNTLIVFASDHGFHLAEHDFWMKVSLHEESVKTPLIIKMPGKTPGQSNALVELLDVYPTIADLAGLNLPQKVQGKNISKNLDNPDVKIRNTAFSMTYRNGIKSFLLRSEKWAYIQYGEDGQSGLELYNMKHDEKQFNNLAYHPKHQYIINKFQQKLKSKLEKIRDNDLGISY